MSAVEYIDVLNVAMYDQVISALAHVDAVAITSYGDRRAHF